MIILIRSYANRFKMHSHNMLAVACVYAPRGCFNGLEICTLENCSIDIGNGGQAKRYLGCLDHLKSISEIRLD